MLCSDGMSLLDLENILSFIFMYCMTHCDYVDVIRIQRYSHVLKCIKVEPFIHHVRPSIHVSLKADHQIYCGHNIAL